VFGFLPLSFGESGAKNLNEGFLKGVWFVLFCFDIDLLFDVFLM
jgi:hypothetical protein